MTEFFEEGIQTQDGALMKFMAQKARQWKMYVCGTIRMRRGDIVYNSAPLYDRQGRLVGIYDKFMLYDPELDDGTTPGDSMPVSDGPLRQSRRHDLLRQLAPGSRPAPGLQRGGS